MTRPRKRIVRSDERPRQWHEIQLVAAHKLLRFFLPTLTLAGLAASILCAYPQMYPTRLAVASSVVVSTIPAWLSMWRQRPMRGLVILISALTIILTLGTVMNGGPLAPAYTAMFIVLAAGVWFVPRLGAVIFVVGFLGLGLGSGYLMDAGLVPEKALPGRSWYAGILTMVAVVVAVTLSKIRSLLHEALESSAKSYELLASVLGAIDDRLLIYSPERGDCRSGIADANNLPVEDLTLDAFLALPLGEVAAEPYDVKGLLHTTLERKTPSRHRVAVTTTSTANTRYIEVTGVPVNACGHATHPEVAMLVRDVTDDELQRQHWTRSQKLEAIGSLASGVAHDFNNVLTGIRTSAEILKEENHLEGEPMLALILESTDRAALLTKRLLLHGRTAHGSHQAMDLMATARETMALVRAALPPGIALHCEFEDDEVRMVGDPASLQGMLLNLALNAAHAVAQRGRIRLRINKVPAESAELTHNPRLNATRPHVAIELEDNGCGIPEEMRPNIFDAFVTTRPTGEGTGLGLWTTRNTVLEHRGEVTFQSGVGVGTTFRILLPIHPSATPDVSATRPPPQDRAVIGGGRIMIIDDEPTIRTSLQLALSKRGFQATAFESGREALAVLSHATTDVVVLDMMMPEMTGYEIFQRIQAMETSPKVILSTGFADLHEIAAMEQQGLFATLNKPYPLELLVTTIESALALQQSIQTGPTSKRDAGDHELARAFMAVSTPGSHPIQDPQRSQHQSTNLASRPAAAPGTTVPTGGRTTGRAPPGLGPS